MSGDKCDRCGAIGNDRRTLWMACMYAMNELGVPFKQFGIHGVTVEPTGTNIFGSPTFDSNPDMSSPHTRNMFTLYVCKGCRSEWMTAIQQWFRAAPGDVVRWNNDASSSPAGIEELLSQLESLRVSHVSLGQQVEDSITEARQEHFRRQQEAGK